MQILFYLLKINILGYPQQGAGIVTSNIIKLEGLQTKKKVFTKKKKTAMN